MKNKFSNLSREILFMSLWTFSLCIYAQNIVVTGTVRDSAGEPLVGVTVQIQGTSHGTVTDYDGGFRIANVFLMLFWNLDTWVCKNRPSP